MPGVLVLWVGGPRVGEEVVLSSCRLFRGLKSRAEDEDAVISLAVQEGI